MAAEPKVEHRSCEEAQDSKGYQTRDNCKVTAHKHYLWTEGAKARIRRSDKKTYTICSPFYRRGKNEVCEQYREPRRCQLTELREQEGRDKSKC